MRIWCIARANCAKKKRYCKCLVYMEYQANEILNIELWFFSSLANYFIYGQKKKSKVELTKKEPF